MVVWFIVDLFSQEHLQQEEEYKVARLSVYKCRFELLWQMQVRNESFIAVSN